jgi:hypothetical protein
MSDGHEPGKIDDPLCRVEAKLRELANFYRVTAKGAVDDDARRMFEGHAATFDQRATRMQMFREGVDRQEGHTR